MLSNHTEMMKCLEGWFKATAYYFSLRELFTWEVRQTMPSGGVAYREKMAEHFSELEHEHLHGDVSRILLDWFSNHPPVSIEHQAMVRELKRSQRFSAVPAELMALKQTLITKATAMWDVCYRNNDAQPWLELVQQLMDVHREIANYVDDSVHPMQVWIDEYEYGLKLSDLDRYFSEITQVVVPLFEQYPVVQRDMRQLGTADKQQIITFCQNIGRQVGYRDDFGVWGQTRLPFSSIIGPQDVRIAVNVSRLSEAISGSLHEIGHAIYTAYAHPWLHNNGLWRPFIGGYDEAMAIFWERMIGMNEEFWQFLFPFVQKGFPEYQSVTRKKFLKQLNAVHPSLIRTEADELTYPLHIMIRYKLEKQLLGGSLKAVDLPEVWNDLYKKTLGIAPENDQEGCLQDVHWSLGLIGYFPSYTMGGMMAAQIHATAKQAGVVEPVTRGDFQPLLDWLIENCYQQGMTEIPQDTLIRVTGKKLETESYLEYLSMKYGDS
jgi:carboxypeptidase Taq